MVRKVCPECLSPVPCASKKCNQCGHNFLPKIGKRKNTGNINTPKKHEERNVHVIISPQRKRHERRASLRSREMLEKKRQIKVKENNMQNLKVKRRRSRSSKGRVKVKRPGYKLDGSEDRRFKQFKNLIPKSNHGALFMTEEERLEREKQERENDVELYNSLSAEKAFHYSMILAELNRKFLAQNFKPS